MSELDHILLEQLISARRRYSRLRRMRRLFHDPKIDFCIENAEGNIRFFESMIQDKRLIKKRRYKVRKEKDVLYRHPVVLYYRNTYMIVKLSFVVLSQYLTLWYKKEK